MSVFQHITSLLKLFGFPNHHSIHDRRAFPGSDYHHYLHISLSLAESIILANCADASRSLFFQIAYLNGSAGGSPNAVAVVPTNLGTTVTWEGRDFSPIFADGNAFTSKIRGGGISDYAYADPAQNSVSTFNCYKHSQSNIYWMPRGGHYDQIYWCNHG